MAIQFTSNHPDVDEVLIIGGKDTSFSSNEKGGYGPFPSYSISREEILAEDGSQLNTKFTINISGFATIKRADSSSAMIRGERQSKVFGEKIIKLQFNRNKFPMLGNGRLEINPYSGTGNQIKFNDARLISVDIAEQTDESPDMHYTEYNFVFEAYHEDIKGLPSYMVSSVEESWELTQNEGQFSFIGNNLTGLPFKTFTLTHTLSATGVRRYSRSGSLDTDGEAWRQAAKWIESRLVNNPSIEGINSHINGSLDGPKFSPFYMDSAQAEGKNIDLSSSRFGVPYKAFNHSRTSGVDISGAGYNVKDTWLVAVENTKCVHDLESSIENNQEMSSISITVNGSVIGLSDSTIVSNLENKYANAKIEYDKIIASTKPFEFANYIYGNINPLFKPIPERPLRDVIIKKSVGNNKITGTITWSVTYNNQDILGDSDKIASEEISINYDNEDLSARQIAIIPIIGRSRGPIIQNFNTNRERKVSLTLDLVMKKNFRPDDPPKTVANEIIEQYEPPNSFVNSRTDNWNKKTGAYNISIEWVYK
jgi:hypothetical protein